MSITRFPRPAGTVLLLCLITVFFALLSAYGVAAAPGDTYTVTKTADTMDFACNADCSLREAVHNANSDGNDTILFDIPASDPGCSADNVCTIVLGSTLPNVSDAGYSTTVDGSGADITIDGDDSVRLFILNGATTLHLKGLSLVDGASVSGGAAVGNVFGGNLVVEDSLLSGHHAPDGAAIYGEATIINSTLTGNQATASGGAIWSEGAISIIDSTFIDNDADANGGTIFLTGVGTATIQGSTFESNGATYDSNARGGAIFHAGSSLTVAHSTFSGNVTTGKGAGIYALKGGTIDYVTFYGNNASAGGGALLKTAAVSTLTVSASLFVAGNLGSNCTTESGGVLTDGGGNISDDASCPTGAGSQNSTDPRLAAALADNGGPTKTHALLNTSPAIDNISVTALLAQEVAGLQAAAMATCEAGTSLDQRGATRAGGVSAGGSACDSGAFEYGSLAPTAMRLFSFRAGPSGPWAWLSGLLR